MTDVELVSPHLIGGHCMAIDLSAAANVDRLKR
jgi:hypothetical protein